MTLERLGSPSPEALDRAQVMALVERLTKAARNARSDEEMRAITSQIAQVTRRYRIAHGIGMPVGPAEQAIELDPSFVNRPHIALLSDRLRMATERVERGQNQWLTVSMPPRAGKSTLISYNFLIWLLRRHPEWKIITASYDDALVGGWARRARRVIERSPRLGIALEKDGGAGWRWGTVEGGSVMATSTVGPLTGRGARVLIIDDPIKDYAMAHSAKSRQAIWDWWLSVALTRLEPPSLVIVVMTRWHEDDFIGRLTSKDHEGDPTQWENVVLPAIAEDEDILGRNAGEPLLYPFAEETPGEAIERWSATRRNVGSYSFSAMYQQRPAPAKGAIFDAGWWRFWTRDPRNVTEDGKVVLMTEDMLSGGIWLDSWDMAFKGAPDQNDYVVGQRWVRYGANRFLIAQQRDRRTFTQTLDWMRDWARPDDPALSPYGNRVHLRLVEDTANGPAIIETLHNEISGIKGVNPHTSKEARARAITPEVESGNVYLPNPSDPGNDWVMDLLSELRNFPYDAHDDQVDALTQALSELRTPSHGQVTVPGGSQALGQPVRSIDRNVTAAARTGVRRLPGSGLRPLPPGR